MKTIQHRVLLLLATAGILPLLVLLFLADFFIGNAIRQSEEEKLTNLNRAVAAHVAAVMDSASEDLRAMQSNPVLGSPDVSDADRLNEIRRLVEVYDFISDVSLYDPQGFLTSSTSEDHPRYRDHSTTFSDSLEKGTVAFSRPHLEVGKPGLFMSVYLPIAIGGTEKQMMVARLDYRRIANVVHAVRPGVNGKIILLDALGNTLSSREGKGSLVKFDNNLGIGVWAEKPNGIYDDNSGNRFYYSASVLDSNQTRVQAPWVLLVMLPEEEVEALLAGAQKGVFLVAIFTFGLASVLGWVFSRRLSTPLVKLSEAAKKVASGDLEVRAEGKGSIEIVQLAISFNQMVGELGDHRDGLEKLVLSRTESLRRSQSELERTSARLQSAIDNTNNGFLVEDPLGGVAVVNRLFLDHAGIDPDDDRLDSAEAILAVFEKNGEISEGSFADWERQRQQGETIDCEISLSKPEIRVLHVFSSPIRDRRGKLVGRVWNTQDLTEQRHLEDSLRQSQKMEAIGQLAGGVAHDFNNLLTGILGNLSLVAIDMETAKKAPDSQENLNLAIKAGERAADLVKQLLGFSRRSQMDLKPCGSSLVLREVKGILSATLDRRVEIELDLKESHWRAMADVSMLSQVIMNMAVNAKDAMPKGGHLKLSSSNRTIDPDELKQHVDAKPGDYLCLSIEDDGEGIPLSVQKRVFEPFFTTKEQGKGTGLGLATSFGIIKQLGGWIEMDSREGEGTRFDIYLPRSAAAEAQPDQPSVATQITDFSSTSKERETILIVDDEDIVRGVAKALLMKLGYHVLEARDGLEGLAAYEEHQDDIDLVLLDLTMPNLSGRDTFRRLRAEYDAEVPVLICSGYLVDVNEFTEECGACPNGFVQKPYRFEDMSDTVRQTIDARKQAA